jgi:hypothetical protein
MSRGLRSVLAVPVAALAAALPLTAAHAAKGPPPFLQGDANGIGAGLVVGTPSGLALAWKPRDRNMIQAELGWGYEGRSPHGDTGLHLNADYAFDLSVIEQDSTPHIRWPVYMGIGGVLYAGSGTALGARVPVGMRMEPVDLRLDVFIELAPVVMLVPATYAGVHFNLGLRYFFGPS